MGLCEPSITSRKRIDHFIRTTVLLTERWQVPVCGTNRRDSAETQTRLKTDNAI